MLFNIKYASVTMLTESLTSVAMVKESVTLFNDKVNILPFYVE